MTTTNIKLPALTGSDKQIAWATDILSDPYKSFLATAQRYADQGMADWAKAEMDAAAEYAKQIAALPATLTAAQVIDMRDGISGLSSRIRAAAYKANGIYSAR